MTIEQMQPGQKARVIDLRKGRGAARRLMEMGLAPGVEFTLLARHPFRGPVVLQVGTSRVALGHRIAGELEVKLQN